MASCSHGFPTPAACVTCMEDGNLAPPPAPEPPAVRGRPFEAKFDGHCAGCNTAIHQGQLVVRLTDDSVRHHYIGCLP